MTIEETHGRDRDGGSELFRSVGSSTDEMLWSTVNDGIFGNGKGFSCCWTTVLVLFFIGFFHLLRSRFRIRSTLSIFRVKAPSPKISPISSSSIASTSNGGRMISDDDLKDLIIDLHPQSSSNKEQVWNELVTKQNNSVFYNAKCCKLENGSIKYLSTTKFLNCSTSLLKDFYMDNEYRVKWDTTVIDHQQLEINSKDMIEFGRTVKKFPFLSPREYVLAWRIWEGKNCDFYCLIKNCEHPQAPQRKGYVRVGFFRSGWKIKKVPDQGGEACEITLVHQEDAGLNPDMAKVAFTRGIWSYICKMDNAFRGYSSWVVSHPKPAISLNCIQFPVGLEVNMAAEPPPQNEQSVVHHGRSRLRSSWRENSRMKLLGKGVLLVGGVVCLSRGHSSLAAQLAIACFLKKIARQGQHPEEERSNDENLEQSNQFQLTNMTQS
ncbi:StAR-related lipid transfer protein [Zostera marina]|uniref:StAR-related lipid transfer protein n=1 Tax=Zostera marina TaxID=29655 RepID=A0A0K9PXK0_ZOSMR|nr:StAR-related lipid transfer protein [Zostera marina]